MVSTNNEIELLRSTPVSNRAEVEAKIAGLESTKLDLRRRELEAIEWKPLWAIPAMFAAAILVLFMLFFRDDSRRPMEDSQPNTSNVGGVA